MKLVHWVVGKIVGTEERSRRAVSRRWSRRTLERRVEVSPFRPARWVVGGACIVLALTLGAAPSFAQVDVIAWGVDDSGQCDVPDLPPGVHYVQIAAGAVHSLALTSDGNVVAWGEDVWGQSDVPALPPGLTYVFVSGAWEHSLAIRSDGSAVAWGRNDLGQCDVPPLPSGLRYTSISGGYSFSAAFRSDGSIVAWGSGFEDQTIVPPLPIGVTYVQLDVGILHALARRSDGSTIGWGANYGGQTQIPDLPAGVTFVDVQAGAISVGRRSDGNVQSWGGTAFTPVLPVGVTCIGIAGDFATAFARLSDGTAISWGNDQEGQATIPPLPTGFVYTDFAVGEYHSLARFAAAPACGSISSYCWPPAANTVDAGGARFTIGGCPSLTKNDLVFTVQGLPAGGPGIFYYGRAQIQVPFGQGWRCVSGGVQRVMPPSFADASGVVVRAIDLTQVPFADSPNAIEAGSNWNFQYWYRDPANSTTTFNTSDAWHVAFVP